MRVTAILVTLLLAIVPATAHAQAEVVFEVPQEPAKVSALLKELRELVKQGPNPALYLSGHAQSASSPRTFVDFRYDDTQITLVRSKGPPVPPKFDYLAMPRAVVIRDTVLGVPRYGIPVSKEWAIWVSTTGFDTDHELNWAKLHAVQFLVAAYNLRTGREALERKISQALQEYPDPGSRPPMPEEARRFRIQAETAVERKDLPGAVKLYGQALWIAPWWAEGYFNVSLLYGEQKNYDGAIRNMKRFLLFEPRHPKAREAQDQIYRWEALAQGVK